MDAIPDTLNDLLTRFLLFMPQLIVALVLFVITRLTAASAGRLAQRLMNRREAGEEITLLISRLARWAVLIFCCVVAVEQIDFDLTASLTGLRILGFTVGFAVQDVSKNSAAGVLLLLQ